MTLTPATPETPMPPVVVAPRKRVAFTICFNALHHLRHNDYVEKLAPAFDRWVFVEGAAANKGSTGWCNPQPEMYLRGGYNSLDGTDHYLMGLATKPGSNIVLVSNVAGKPWDSKDAMVNAALPYLSGPAYLWEIDADEQWTAAQLDVAESRLHLSGCDTGLFECDYYLGPGIMARGVWGEAKGIGYTRLWKWDGKRKFKTHEPPVLEGGNGRTLLMPEIRFQHYAYYYEQDVIYKEQWYGGHQGIHERWKALQTRTDYPLPISEFLRHPVFSKTATTIERI